MSTQSGIFGQVQILDVVRIINSQRSTGAMRIVSKDGTVSGTLYIQRGEVVNATCGLAEGEEAAYDLFAVALEPGGMFNYKSPNAIASLQARTISRSFQDLIFQAGKIVDTKRRVYAAFPDQKLVPYFLNLDRKASGVKLHDEDKTVATAIDGRMDFAEITSATGMHELAVLQTACMLKDAQVIDVVAPHARGVVRRKRRIPLLLKARQAVLSAKLETWWRAMPPFANGIMDVALTTSTGARHRLSGIRFDPGLAVDEIALTDDYLTEYGLTVGEEIWLKPA